VAISPDGKKLALGDANEIQLWDIPRDRQLGQLKVSEAHPLLFRPDGKALAVHKMKMNEQIELWDLDTGRPALETRRPGR
jgi:WD40 repeat protein